MNLQRAGFWALVWVILVDFGQVHRIVPSLSHLMPGAIGEAVLLVLVLIELPRGRWVRNIAVWRLLFMGAIATGILIGVTQGRSLLIFRTELPRYFTTFLGACVFVRRIEDLRVLQNAFIAMAFLLAAWVLTHGGHGPGLYKDENDAALVLVMLLPFAFLKIFGEPSPRKLIASGAVFFLTLLGIGLTLSRGGMVGTMPSLFFGWLKSRNKAIGLALAAVALVGAVVFAPKDFKTEFESIADTQQGTAETRRLFWDLSVQMFEERPIFGVGASCWGNALYAGVIDIPDKRLHITPHSVYFQLLSELGIVGVFCVMGLLVSVARTLRELSPSRLRQDAALIMPEDPDPALLRRFRSDQIFMRNFCASLAIGIIGYLVCGAFLSVLFYPGLAIFAGLVQGTREAWQNEIRLATALRFDDDGAGEGEKESPVATSLPARPAPQATPVVTAHAARPATAPAPSLVRNPGPLLPARPA